MFIFSDGKRQEEEVRPTKVTYIQGKHEVGKVNINNSMDEFVLLWTGEDLV